MNQINGLSHLVTGRPTPQTEVNKARESFADMLKDSVTQVEEQQQAADLAQQKLYTGEGGSLHGTMIAIEEAQISLRLLVQVRNKMLEAYQEIMRMQL